MRAGRAVQRKVDYQVIVPLGFFLFVLFERFPESCLSHPISVPGDPGQKEVN
jgi:hypothetical protein